METLKFLHVVAMVAWLGTATSEILLEFLLWRTKSASRQKAYIELHRTVDLVLEGPALLLTLLTGFLLLWKGGYFADTKVWPKWLEDKLICVAVVMALNLVCIEFVLLRAKAASWIMGAGAPLESSSVKKWHMAVTSTFAGVPFALMALWFAVNH